MTHLVDRARRFVLSYFKASPEEYVVIFTPNASGALKLVGESYPFAPGGRYLLTFDNHNSVNGIREFAQAKGAPITYVPLSRPICASTRLTCTACWRRPPRTAQSVCLPSPVQMLDGNLRGKKRFQSVGASLSCPLGG